MSVVSIIVCLVIGAACLALLIALNYIAQTAMYKELIDETIAKVEVAYDRGMDKMLSKFKN